MRGRGEGAPGGVTGAASWLVQLWWLTAQRRWRRESGALFGAGLAAVLSAWLTASPPPAAGLPLYHTTILALLLVGVVFAPLLLSAENVIASRRMQLLPISPALLRVARLVLGNSLRALFALLLLVWGLVVAVIHRSPPLAIVQLFGWLLLGLSLSQLLEDLIRHGRAVVLHQLLFLGAVASWPLLYERLRDHSNFAPPPAWSTGAVYPFLFGSRGGAPAELAVCLGLFALAALTAAIDGWFMQRQATRAPGGAAGAGWTGGVVRWVAAPLGGSAALRKELLILLRFLFFRATLVMVAGSVAAAFVLANPYLLLILPFWWQSLASNALAPDVGSGELRYHLLGLSPRQVLPVRLAAQIVATVAIALIVSAGFAAAGALAAPHFGPQTRWMYPLALVYAISLILLAAAPGDRYSLRYPDPIDMNTLLPERRHGSSAGAMLLIVGIWGVIGVVATVGLVVAVFLARLVFGPTLGFGGIAMAAILGAAFNASIYSMHLRYFRPAAHVH